MITPTDPTLTARIAALETRIRSLELADTGVRPQLFVLAPATCKTGANRVPYSVVAKNTGTWSGSPNYQWTIPISGLWLLQVQSKMNGSGGQSNLALKMSDSRGRYAPASPTAAWQGGSLTSVMDMTAGVTAWIEETGGFTPQNDTYASNYWQLTWLGRTT
jgi:hypothetical protein